MDRNMLSKFDNLLTELGTGPWNYLYFLMTGYHFFVWPMQSYNAAVMAPHIDYTCLPAVSDDSSMLSFTKDSCAYFLNSSETPEEVQCTTWRYDNLTFASTLTTEFDLVCDKSNFRAYYTSAFMVGNFISNPVFGHLGDKFGRKKTVMLAALCYTIPGILISFAPSLTTILIARAFIGTAMVPNHYVFALEICEPKWRGVMGIILAFPWAIGVMSLGGLGYLFRDWRNLQLAVSLPLLLLIPLIWILDESPRWLIVNGRHEEALKVLQRAERLNRATLPQQDKLRQMMKEIQEAEGNRFKDKCTSNFFLTCSSWTISKITIVMILDFTVAGLVFYGLSLSGSTYSDDPYLYMVLSGVMEAPAYSLSAPIIEKFGRKVSTSTGYLIAGISVIAITFAPQVGWLVMTLALIGKLGISAAFQMIFLYITELFPTVVRQQGFGYAEVGARMGGFISPFITEILAPVVWWGPSVVFGGFSILAGLLTLTLHETKDIPLPDTINDLEQMKKKNTQRKEDNKA
ncbi:unnamed protein product [Meganyctiphanes norvegica]|uniref:Major facilitator superfamily (MFS) profile domain-containing protein n=1 Tax=Meganyctiphanes norvegica TaxID=48144 RepID=A0AAV2QSB6_MEGNR